jgi:sugar lactone lactonase YvrE
MRSLPLAALASGLVACADVNYIQVDLAPSVISSLDGTTTLSAIVTDQATPLDGIKVGVTVVYTDRNGMPHPIDPVEGKTDARGVFRTELTGLAWDGVGTVTVDTDNKVSDAVTFAVLDRTPPKLEILPPTTDKRVGPGLPLDVQVHVTDEIGISEVTIDGTGTIQGARSTLVVSGAQDQTVTFRMAVPQGAQTGPTIELHALARDLSGNIAAASVVTLTVDPAITIATPPGLAGAILVDGTANQLANPRAIVLSPKDGHLYVADQAATGACNPSCIWRVDAGTGAIDAAPLIVGAGRIEGLALDATGDNLYYTDRQNRTGRLTWNGSTAYATPAACSDPAQQKPQDPYHLVVDATLGLLVVDDNGQDVQRLATCASTSVGTAFTMSGNFDQPRGIAAGGSGEFYVSDINRDRVSRVNATTGAVSIFDGSLQEPYGMEWVPGTSTWANSLMVAAFGDRIVASTKGMGSLAAAYLRNNPVDLTFAGGTMYVITAPSGGNRGRIYKVTGF